MKSYTLRYTTRCPSCQQIKRHEYHGLGESHAQWLVGLRGTLPGYHCPFCKIDVRAQLFDVEVTEHG